MSLYQHLPHPHEPRNVNAAHTSEHGGTNARIAVQLTRLVGSMWTAYLFVVLAFVGLAGILGLLNPVASILVAWLSQTLIQLVLLPVILVGQNVLSRKQELQADEDFRINQSAFHDIEQIMQHLAAQDEELLKQTAALKLLLAKTGALPETGGTTL